ncbi:MAG: amino acid ABC transporter permease, partial [Slackia sp.]
MDTCIKAPAASPTRRRPEASLARAILLAIAALILGAALLAAVPAPAQALDVESCTASPNEDGGDRILGATPTRVTWRAHAAEDESLSRITL